MELEIFEINQIAIFKANRLMVQDLLVLESINKGGIWINLLKEY